MKKTLPLLLVATLLLSACSSIDEEIISEVVEEIEEIVDLPLTEIEEDEDCGEEDVDGCVMEEETEEIIEIPELEVVAGEPIAFYGGGPMPANMEQYVEDNHEELVAMAIDYPEWTGERWSDEERTLEDWDFIVEHAQQYHVGFINEGEYEGYELHIMQGTSQTMYGGSVIMRYAYSPTLDEYVLLANHSGEWSEWAFLGLPDKIDETTVFEQLEAPEEISLPDYPSNAITHVESYVRYNQEIAAEAEEIEGMDGWHYYFENGCIVVRQPDGVTLRYLLLPGAFANDTEESLGSLTKTLDYIRIDGSSVTKDYSLAANGGCGFSSGCVTQHEASETEESLLVEMGTVGGETVYMFKELPENGEAAEGLEMALRSAYNNYVSRHGYSDSEDEALEKAEWMHSGDVFFMQFDDGVYTTVYNADYVPAVECGKPVIYLYPEEEMEVNVQVHNIDFTVTIPEYVEGGWDVIAQPNGELLCLNDGEEYDYLFWEGLSDEDNHVTGEWTLHKSEVRTELTLALLEMGLNLTETADFMEFWLPLLLEEDSEYIAFSFVGTEDFNKIAPLEITPAPETLIRIFMVYRGVDEAMEQRPTFKALPREGFTVVEWGGTLYN